LFERLKFLAKINHETVILTIAGLLVQRKTTDSCNQYDAQIDEFVTVILDTLSGIDDGFINQPISNPYFKLFFESDREKKIPSANVLLKTLYENMMISGFEESENKMYNLESLSGAIGAFAKNDVHVDEYYEFVLNCLSKEPSGKFKELNSEIRMKMAIRAFKQAGKLNPELTNAYKTFPFINGCMNFVIETLFGKTTKIPIQEIKKEPVKIGNMSFFKGLNLEDFAVVMEDSCDSLKDKLKEFPNNRKEIIQRVIMNLLEKITKDTIVKLKDILVLLSKHLPIQEMIIEADIIKKDQLDDIKIDVPFATTTFGQLVGQLIFLSNGTK
jgi:hypothetical protein